MKIKENILLVANWESDVGYAWWLMENFWTEISTHFNKKGMWCYLIYPKITKIPKSIKESSIQTLEYDFGDHSFANLSKLKKLIDSNSIKFIYLSDSPSFSFFYLLLRLWGIKKIVNHDHTPGDHLNPTGLKKAVKYLIHRIPYYTADHYIAVSEFVKQRYLEVSRVPPLKCSVAPNGIIPYELDNIDINYAKREFEIPEKNIVIVSTGRATFYKGIDFIINCAYELIYNKGVKNLHFLYCGDGPEIATFKNMVSELGLKSNFTFAGKRDDIDKILPSCEIGLHASKGEVGYSLSILEFMSAGLATIVPDLRSVSGAIENGKTGILYNSESIESACEAIKECLDRNTRNRLAQSGKAVISTTYNINNTNNKLINILDNTYR
jgi:glycosyltransferase involved in cell wall biosynthesis